MDLITILLIAVGLAMDAFAVAVASGISLKRHRARHALRIAAFFGAFQAIMPVLGWLAGLTLQDYIAGIDHWIAFGLLVGIGVKMIVEAFKLEEDEKDPSDMNLHLLFLLSIATSIDALAVGLSFAFLEISIATPAIIIGVVTFVLALIGVHLGSRVGHLFENKIEIIGGAILIGIGAKILLEHTKFLTVLP